MLIIKSNVIYPSLLCMIDPGKEGVNVSDCIEDLEFSMNHIIPPNKAKIKYDKIV